MALGLCDRHAGQPHLYPGVGVDGVINAAVVGDIAARETGVGGIDDGIAFEGRSRRRDWMRKSQRWF